MSVAAHLPQDRRARLVDFVDRMRRRHARLAADSAALRWALACSLPALGLAWIAPQRGWWIGGAVALLAGLAAAFAALRARRITNAALLRVTDVEGVGLDELGDGRAPLGDGLARLGDGLARLGDGLATWLEHDRAAFPPSMTDWLASDLDREIRALPPAAVRDVGRRRLGRLRWIIPILILLLLAWLLSLWWQPSWSGLLGGRPDLPDSAPASVPAVGGVAGVGEAEVESEDQPTDPQPGGANEPPPEVPTDPQPDPVEPPPAEPPAPLLKLPPQQVFVVPEFIEDGPSRRMRAHVAEVGGGENPAVQPPARQPGEGAAPTPPVPAPRREQFDRAAERAQAARHVPRLERPMVRRFFRLLREAAK